MFKGLPVGVHLTLTSEHRGYRWRGLTNGTTLYDTRGLLPGHDTGRSPANRCL